MKEKKLAFINWLPEDKLDYSADPFCLEKDNKEYVFYEEFEIFRGKGIINCIELSYGFNQKKKVVFSPHLNCHLSYPYIFSYENNIYCIPETAQLNKVSLFRAEDFPEKWVKVKDILEEFNGVDSSLIYFQSKWWMFTSPQGRNEELHLFYSDSLFGRWLPHKKNPVKRSKQSSRGAGQIIIFNDNLYRPAQNLTNQYGGSIIINKIEDLTESSFTERELFEILPDEKNYPEGIHNISFGRNKIIVDGKRKQFSLSMPLKKIRGRYLLPMLANKIR